MLADAQLSLERYEAAARDYRTLIGAGPAGPEGVVRPRAQLRGPVPARLRDAPGLGAGVRPTSCCSSPQGLVAQERDKSAFPLYREAIAKKPGLAEAHEALARIYERSGHAGLGRGRAREGEGAAAARLPHREPRVRLPRGPVPRRSSRPPGRCGPRRAATGPPAPPASWPARRSPASPGCLPRRRPRSSASTSCAAQRRYSEIEGGAAEGGLGVAGGPADPPRAGDAALHRPRVRGGPPAPGGPAEARAGLGGAQPAARRGVARVEGAREGHPLPREGRSRRPEAPPGPRASSAARTSRPDRPSAPIPHLEAALPTDEDGSLHFQLARAYRETGRAEQATRTLAAFQELRRANEARQQSEKEEFAITPP